MSLSLPHYNGKLRSQFQGRLNIPGWACLAEKQLQNRLEAVQLIVFYSKWVTSVDLFLQTQLYLRFHAVL